VTTPLVGSICDTCEKESSTQNSANVKVHKCVNKLNPTVVAGKFLKIKVIKGFFQSLISYESSKSEKVMCGRLLFSNPFTYWYGSQYVTGFEKRIYMSLLTKNPEWWTPSL